MAALPDLQTDRLRLRPFVVADAARVRELAGERDIADTTLNVPHPYEAGMAESWIASHAAAFSAGELLALAIADGRENTVLGAISLTLDPRANHANLGYWIGRPYWNRGYCSEAAAALLDYAFGGLGLQRVHARHLERNRASGRVMQKLGMQREGLQRQHALKWGRYENLVLYGLLREDWPGPATRAAGQSATLHRQ